MSTLTAVDSKTLLHRGYQTKQRTTLKTELWGKIELENITKERKRI